MSLALRCANWTAEAWREGEHSPRATRRGEGLLKSRPPSDVLEKGPSPGHLWPQCVAGTGLALLSGTGLGGERARIGGLHAAVSPSRQGHVEELWGLATHPSRAQFVTCGQDKLVHLWSAESRRPLWSRIIEVRGLGGGGGGRGLSTLF